MLSRFPNSLPFVRQVSAVHSFYRRGNFDVGVVADETHGYVESVNRVAVSLREVADNLFWQVADGWNSPAGPMISAKYFAPQMRSMTISFEIDEYFIEVSPEKRKFFEDIRREFFDFEEAEISAQDIRTKIDCFATNIAGFDSEKHFVPFAYELILLSMCGINCLLLNQSAKGYQIALDNTKCLEKIIERVLEIAHTSPENKALGIRGLNYYFQGRCYFSLGQSRNCETAFKKSVSCYYEKMNLLAPELSEEAAETRTLALRRAGLAEIIGLANLYLVESRIDEAFEIVERVSPLLKFAVGKRMIAYCDLIRASVNRAKYSSNVVKLGEIERSILTCLKTLGTFSGKPHTYYRGIVELSLVRHYQPREIPKEFKIECYRRCVCDLSEALKFAEQEDGKFVNRRIAIEAVTLRSHIYRHLADVDHRNCDDHLQAAYSDAFTAIEYSKSLSQLSSDAYIALGMVYRSRFLKTHESGTNVESVAINKEAARDCFFKALELNVDDNKRLLAICYLRLAELESLKHQSNFVKAKLFFEKFKTIKGEISHQYILDFGSSLERLLEHTQSLLFIDPEESLKLDYWKDKVRVFLIDQTVYQAAIKYKDSLPDNRRRGEPARNSPSSIKDKASKRKQRNATRQSILADFFEKEMGITSNERYILAGQHLTDFERYCEELNR